MYYNLNNNMSDQPLWSKAYTLASKYTKSTWVTEFQIKFLHRRIATNDFLMKIRPYCDFCGDGKEGLTHLLRFCPKLSSIWSSLVSELISLKVLPTHHKLNVSLALDLRPDSSKSQHQINFTCHLARYYIWICKKRKWEPNLVGFLEQLKPFMK